MNSLQKTKKVLKSLNVIHHKKWFLRWWGILIILFSLALILSSIYFFILVNRYQKAIISGSIISNNLIAGYSKIDNTLDDSKVTIDRQALEKDDAPSIGSKKPVMTIVIFSDFDCPYCAIFYPILKKFVLENSEKVKLIFRDYPVHDYKSALAGNCAFEQNRFWDMHDKLFYYQNNISDEVIKKIAKNIRLDVDKFNQCYESEKYKKDIKKDMALAMKSGVQGTPTIFVNGAKFAGIIPETILKQILSAIEAEAKLNQ